MIQLGKAMEPINRRLLMWCMQVLSALKIFIINHLVRTHWFRVITAFLNNVRQVDGVVPSSTFCLLL